MATYDYDGAHRLRWPLGLMIASAVIGVLLSLILIAHVKL